MIIRSVDLVISAAAQGQFPPSNYPEIAFVGRSNVGKSSLINALLNRKRVAYVSGRPGKTQTINFFNINERFHLVDLPGYGYAAVSKSKKAGWGKLIEQYLKNRPQLRLVLHLVDSRHEPSELDLVMAEMLQSFHRPRLVVGTKRDKYAKSQWQKQASMLQKSLSLEAPPQLFTVNEAQPRQELWQRILEMVPELREAQETPSESKPERE